MMKIQLIHVCMMVKNKNRNWFQKTGSYLAWEVVTGPRQDRLETQQGCGS